MELLFTQLMQVKKLRVIFPLAESNKIRGKCQFYSHISWGLGIGRVTERRVVAFVASAITDRPTHPPPHPKISGLQTVVNVMCNFAIWLVSHLSRGMLCVHFYEFVIRVRLRRSTWHGYQWFVRKRNLARTESTMTPYRGDVVLQFQTSWCQHLRSVSLKFRPLYVHISECMLLIAITLSQKNAEKKNRKSKKPNRN